MVAGLEGTLSQTRGHGTTGMAKFYAKELGRFMQQTEKAR
jgi:homoserine O-acetyltransferase